MKRGGAGRLGSVVMPQESCAMRRPVAGPREGRRRERNITVEIQKNHHARVGKILSEGEHRCVALAAFFAELAMIEGRSAIVFDGPVSSLDHNYRVAVTNRLAEEGRHRQTVVFTHDIAFLFLLVQACRDKGTHVGYRSVTRTEDHSGIVQQDPPVQAQPTEKVIEGMQRQIDNRKHFYMSGRTRQVGRDG